MCYVCVCVLHTVQTLTSNLLHDWNQTHIHMRGHTYPPTFDPNIAGSHDGKHEEEEDKDEGLQIVGGHPLHTIQDCAE